MFDAVAGYITRSLKLSCGDCVSDVIDAASQTPHGYPSRSLIGMKDRGGLTRPSHLVYSLCLVTERELRATLASTPLHRHSFQQIRNASITTITDKRLIQKSSCGAHAARLIREVVKRFITIRLRHIANTKKHESNRSRLNRLVIFSHN